MANNKNNASEKNYFDIPVWRRYTLTIEEAAGYYHIGEGKLRMLIEQNPHEDFYVMNGNRALIKREKFERYLDQATAVSKIIRQNCRFHMIQLYGEPNL